MTHFLNFILIVSKDTNKLKMKKKLRFSIFYKLFILRSIHLTLIFQTWTAAMAAWTIILCVLARDCPYFIWAIKCSCERFMFNFCFVVIQYNAIFFQCPFIVEEI